MRNFRSLGIKAFTRANGLIPRPTIMYSYGYSTAIDPNAAGTPAMYVYGYSTNINPSAPSLGDIMYVYGSTE